jgi:uncharacterized secreted protein with C-terminal beta-propeller domain
LKLIAALAPFDACDDFLSWVKAEARTRVQPWGLPGVGGSGWMDFATTNAESGKSAVVPAIRSATGPVTTVGQAVNDASASGAAGTPAAAPSVASADAGGAGVDGAAQPSFSSTNVQEEGVDEPDVVKTDGKRIVALTNETLRVIDVSSGSPVEVGSLDLGPDAFGSQVLLAGDRALVLGQGNGLVWREGAPAVVPPDASGAIEPRPDDVPLPSALLREVDLSDPKNPHVVAEERIEGAYLDARLIGTTARVVLQSSPSKLQFLSPSGPNSEDRARQANLDVVDESTSDDWLPSYVTRDGSGATVRQGSLVACDRVHHPAEFTGFSTTTVLTVDLAAGLASTDSVAVLADAQQVYASAENLYVAVNRYETTSSSTASTASGGDATGGATGGANGSANRDANRDAIVEGGGETMSTAIHQFSIAGTAPAAYLASGVVRGHLLDPFSMSEHGGVLRVATTDGTTAGACCGVTPRPMPAPAAAEPPATAAAAEGSQGSTAPAASSASGTASANVAGPATSPPTPVTTGPSTTGPTATSTADDDTTSAVVSTIDVPQAPTSESFVTTLRRQDGNLVQLGQVGGLGRGEQIYAVRFLGDVGYVVTFRRTDPLYTVDLSDPSAPTLRGELKILGYSAYLHPLGDGRLLGIGQAATEDGRATGPQATLFDVSDLGAPKAASQVSLPSGWSGVEQDYHAFLWWAPAGLAAVPVQLADTEVRFNGVIGLHVAGDQVSELGRISHPVGNWGCPAIGGAPTTPGGSGIAAPSPPIYCVPPSGAAITRSIVVGDALYTLSDAGLKTSALSDLAERSWLPFS